MAASFKDTLKRLHKLIRESPQHRPKTNGYTEDEMIAFGDGMNDLTMLKYVGNAVDEVKANAQYITASNNEEGITKALYKYIPKLKN